MKPEIRYRQADLNELYIHKMTYDKHKKKLQQLAQRKSFNLDQGHISQIEAFKIRKHKSFLRVIKDRNQDISRSNLKIFEKLSSNTQQLNDSSFNNTSRAPDDQQRVSSSTSRPASMVPHKSLLESNPFQKRVLQQTEKENIRMSDRLKSLVSSINTKKMVKDYEKSQEYRNRISRYESDSVGFKKTPKSQRYLNVTVNKSLRSQSSLTKIPASNTTGQPKKIVNLKQLQRQAALSTSHNADRKISFYNHEAIKNNRVDAADNHLMRRRKMYVLSKQLNTSSNKPFTPLTDSSTKVRATASAKLKSEDNKVGSFFTTDPKPQEPPTQELSPYEPI